jgi:uncharacterized protein YjcR
VALEALHEQQPIHDIVKRYQIHPNQVTEWKNTLLEQTESKIKSIQKSENKNRKLINSDKPSSYFHHRNIQVLRMVLPPGLEPRFSAPETDALSIELREQ